MSEINIADVDQHTFEPFVGREFTVVFDDGELVLKLDNIKVFERSGKRSFAVVADGEEILPRQPFALTWEGPLDPELRADNYRITHPDTGEMVLYLSPFMREPGAMLYESVFS